MNEETWKLRSQRYEKFKFSGSINRRLAELGTDNHTAVLWIAKDYFIMGCVAYAVLTVSWWLYPIAVILIGAHQRGLTTIAHDSAHRILAKNKNWNFFLGVVFASYPIFQKHYSYRVSHVFKHHPHLGDPELDPDLRFFIDSGVYQVRPPLQYFLRLVVFPILGGATFNYLQYVWTNRFRLQDDPDEMLDKNKTRLDSIFFFTFWAVVTGLCVYSGLLAELALFWLIPYLTAFQILGWFVEIAEHSPMCETETQNVYLTRNRKGNLLERILFGVNLDEYHLEHHLSPGIPFWNLKKAQKIRLEDPEYTRIAQTWGGLFFDGKEGQSSVIRQLLDRNASAYRKAFPLENGQLQG